MAALDVHITLFWDRDLGYSLLRGVGFSMELRVIFYVYTKSSAL